MGKMSDADLVDLVRRRRDASLTHLTDKHSRDRREAQQFYRGDNLSLYGNSGDGLSTVVSRDVMEAIEALLPGLVKPFVAGEETVRFEPNHEKDEAAAKMATTYINYLFHNHNNSFRVIYDLMKDGLQYRLGVAKIVHEEADDTELQTYQGLTQLQVDALKTVDKVTIVGDLEQDPQTGLFDVKVSVSSKRSLFKVYVVAPDEFLFEERLASLREARFLGHRTTKPVGDFIAMGLDKKKCMALKTQDRNNADNDDRFENEDRRDDSERDDDIARMVTVDECYVRCDYEGVGVLGWRKIFIGANASDLLSNEEVDDHPYEAWTPIPVPHKLVGQSIHDQIRDIQMQKTALIRETMNALYLSNRPQREVVEGQVNFEDLLNPEIGGLVRVKQPGMIREVQSGGEAVMQQSLAMIEHLDGMREERTGSTRYNQGMDANSLNKTATGISIISNASTQRQELIARQFAESAMRGIFRKMLALVCRYGEKAQIVKVNGSWVQMDPNEWRDDYDMTVAVGLGTGDKTQQVQQLMQLIQMDSQIVQLQGGANGPLLTMENIFEKFKRLVEAMGFKGLENYYTDPAKEAQQGQGQQSGGPSPEQQQAQQAQQDAEAERQNKLQIEQMRTAAHNDMEMSRAQIEANTKIEVAKIQAEASILIAGMKVPPELSAAGGPQMPSEAMQAPTPGQMPPQAPQGPPQGFPDIDPSQLPPMPPYQPVNQPTPQGDDIPRGPPQ